MFNKWEKYSYVDKKSYVVRMRLVFLRVLSAIVVYFLLTNACFFMIVMESASMQPSLQPGERIVFSGFNVYNVIKNILPLGGLPYKRGDIVVINTARDTENPIFNIFDRMLRFFSAGKAGLPGKKGHLFVKRVIGLPGDEISMVNFVVQVRPAGNPYTQTEYEFSDTRFYELDIPSAPAILDDSLPFSGNFSKRTLNEREYFVLSDTRGNTNDSRTWGAIPLNFIEGKALFRYWPPGRLSIF
jgi:signal peptidase I